MYLFSLRFACFLVLFASPSLGQRFHRHARKISKYHGTAGSTGAAFPTGTFNSSDPFNGRNYTFKPHRTRPTSASLSTTVDALSFNPGGPEIPATDITISDPQTTSCSTTLTGFFTKVNITDCTQTVTFSTQSSFSLATTTIPANGIFRSPSTSTYIQSVIVYNVAPYQSIINNDMSNITVVTCTYDQGGAQNCTQGQQFWEVYVNYVSIFSTATITTTLTMSSDSRAVIMSQGGTIPVALSSGVNEIPIEQIITSSMAVYSTSTSQIEAPTPLPTSQAVWRTDVQSGAFEPSAIVAAPPAIHDKAEAVSYAAPPGGWGAVSYPANAGAGLSSYAAPPGGWAAVSYPADAGADLSSYPAPPGGWGAVSYPPEAGANPPAAITSAAASTTAISPTPDDQISSSASAPASVTTLTTTATSISTVHTIISMTTTIMPTPSSSIISQSFSSASANGSIAANELDADALTTTISLTSTTTIIVYTVPISSSAS